MPDRLVWISLEIWTYLADHGSIDRADQMLRDLHEAMGKLAVMPGIGHQRKDLADESLRIFVVHSYLVVYRPSRSPFKSSAYYTVHET